MSALAYVSNANKVSIIDTSTDTVVNAITIESANNITKLIAITPDGRFAYVAFYEKLTSLWKLQKPVIASNHRLSYINFIIFIVDLKL